MLVLKKMKIGTRLMTGFCIILFLVVLSGSVSLIGTYRLYKTMKTTLGEDAKLAEMANTAFRSTISMSRCEKNIIMTLNDGNKIAAVMQWKNEVSTLSSYLDILLAMVQNFNRKEQENSFKEAKKILDSYSDGFGKVCTGIIQGEITSVSAANKASEPFQNDSLKLESLIKDISQETIRSFQDARDASESASTTTFIFVSVSVIVSIVVGILISLLISSSIRNPLNELSARVKDISEGEGDLTMSISVVREDETGVLAAFFNNFVSRIRTVVRDTKDASSSLMITSKNMNETAMRVTENVRDQAASAEEISATMDEVSRGVDSIALSANAQYDKLNIVIEYLQKLSEAIHSVDRTVQESLRLSRKVSDNSKASEESVNLMNSSMSLITDSSGKISGIVRIITDISDKINLLSLNAAIEAARAGDAGRGFAVVADEISKLAEQTAGSIKEIDKLVLINKTETAAGLSNVYKTNSTIQESIEGVNQIVVQIDEIFTLMHSQLKINTDVDCEVNSLKAISDEIRIATIEQKSAFSEIIKSISLISELSQSNADSSQNLAETSSVIASLSQTLDSRVNFFKV
jgi:methyl-accepting chemotaxis protein